MLRDHDFKNRSSLCVLIQNLDWQNSSRENVNFTQFRKRLLRRVAAVLLV